MRTIMVVKKVYKPFKLMSWARFLRYIILGQVSKVSTPDQFYLCVLRTPPRHFTNIFARLARGTFYQQWSFDKDEVDHQNHRGI